MVPLSNMAHTWKHQDPVGACFKTDLRGISRATKRLHMCCTAIASQEKKDPPRYMYARKISACLKQTCANLAHVWIKGLIRIFEF